MEIVNTLWVEKFRPKTIDDLVLPEEYSLDFKKSIEKQDIPHLLFYGPPGSGKSSIARILTSKNGMIQNKNDNVLEINGSAKETRGISYVQDGIEPFLKIPPAGNDKYKIVFIDEMDYMTDSAFSALRNVVEKYSQTSRFICTCNYISKIPDAIQSRMQSYKFERVSKEYIEKYCSDILKIENIKFDKDSLLFVIDSLYPDIRKVINCLQKSSLTGELKVNKDISLSIEKTLVDLTSNLVYAVKNKDSMNINKNLKKVLDLLNENDDVIDYRSVYQELFFKGDILIQAKVIINKYSNSHNQCLVPKMHFIGMIFDIIQTIQEYYKALRGK